MADGRDQRRSRNKKNPSPSQDLGADGQGVAAAAVRTVGMQGSLTPTDPVGVTSDDHGEQPDKIVHDGEIEGLDWSDAQLREQIHVYMDKLNFCLPDEDDDFWSVYDDQELEKLNERLALRHIRAHKVYINTNTLHMGCGKTMQILLSAYLSSCLHPGLF